MSDLAHGAQHEFWRPPATQSSVSANDDCCRRCGTELLVGAAFCHICGINRHRGVAVHESSWARYFSALSALDFSPIQDALGLPVPALIAFLVGVVFVILALGTGLVNAEFEAIQLWRMQWLIAACAAFLAGILLKRPHTES